MARLRRRADSSRFVAATQITKANVGRLQVAWTYPAGETDFNPLVVRGVVYGRGRNDSFVALDAATGKRAVGPRGRRRASTSAASTTGRARTAGSPPDLQRRQPAAGDRRADRQADHRRSAQAGRSICATGSIAIRRRSISRAALPGRVFENLIILGSATNQEYGSAPGRHPRVRRAHRQAGVDVPHRAAPGRVRLRHLAEGRLEDRRRRQQLGRAVDRRAARHRLRPDRQPEIQLLRRQPQGRQPLRRLPDRARCAHRQAPLALPDRAPRHLGSRQQLGAAADRRSATTAAASTSSRWPARPAISTSSIA